MDLSKLKAAGIWVLARLEEPSTFAGGSIMFILIHQIFHSALADSILGLLTALGAFLAIVLPTPNRTVVNTSVDASGNNATIVLPKDATTTINTSDTHVKGL